jgi:hypothetical protein
MKVLRFGAVLLLGVTACGRGEEKAASPVVAEEATPDRAATAAALANAIAANPALTDSILSVAGFTPDSFQQLMYEIAIDSAMSASYTAARAR